jgi:glycosyltransferase involved in cell wall biosynthesis
MYSGEESEARATDYAVCITREQQKLLCDVSGPSSILNATWDPNAKHWQTFNKNVIDGINKIIQPRDIILLSAGHSQSAIVDAFPNHLKVEYAAGYTGVHEETFRVFPSYAWMHTVYGQRYGSHGTRGRFFDRVIPHYVDPEDFPILKYEPPVKPYLAFVGRLNEDKGIGIAIDVAKKTGLHLKIAGQGNYPIPDDVEKLGLIGIEERNRLMSDAVAVLAPSLYLEPFGMVAIEAQICARPVITTNWGAFPETVENGVTGYRCNMFRDFVEAVESSRSCGWSRYSVHWPLRAMAIKRFGTEGISKRYESYFRELTELHERGWYAPPTVGLPGGSSAHAP